MIVTKRERKSAYFVLEKVTGKVRHFLQAITRPVAPGKSLPGGVKNQSQGLQLEIPEEYLRNILETNLETVWLKLSFPNE